MQTSNYAIKPTPEQALRTNRTVPPARLIASLEFMRRSVVLDKSYLDGAPTNAVRMLCEKYNVLVTDELFYELISTRPASLTRCFSKFPRVENPVSLLPGVYYLRAAELETQGPAGSILIHKIPGRFIFNETLATGEFVFDEAGASNLEKWKTRIGQDTEEFIARVACVHGFFPELSGIPWRDFQHAIKTARKKVALVPEFVIGVYRTLCSWAPEGEEKTEPLNIDPSWVTFRWLQAQLLTGLRIFGRYQGDVLAMSGDKFKTRMEHTMLDCAHVIHASVLGGLASMDEEVIEDFRMICPTGLLFTKDEF